MIERHDIQRMLDRFMDGATTEAEEQLLADYFCEAADLPAEWEAYAVLFRGFRHQAVSPDHHVKIVSMKRWLSVAASVLVIFGLGWYYIKSLDSKSDVPTKAVKPVAIVTPKAEQTNEEKNDVDTEAGQKSESKKSKRKRTVKKVERLVAVAEEPSLYNIKSLEPKADIPTKSAKSVAIVMPKAEQANVEQLEMDAEAEQKSEPQILQRKRAETNDDRHVAVAEEPSEPSLLDIDMEEVQQRGEDLRLAMAIMNQELLETE